MNMPSDCWFKKKALGLNKDNNYCKSRFLLFRERLTRRIKDATFKCYIKKSQLRIFMLSGLDRTIKLRFYSLIIKHMIMQQIDTKSDQE